MMIEFLVTQLSSSKARCALLASALLSTATSAQVSGYPIDPYQSGNASTAQSSSTQQRASSTTDQSARGAAQTQSVVPDSSVSSYSPDQITEPAPGFNYIQRPVDRDRGIATQEDELTRPLRRPPPPSEFEEFASKVVDKPLRRFGANLLVPDARDFTAPPTTTVPPDYRLNPGDELLIGLTGSVQASNLRLRIDSDGRIFVPRVGAVSVAGMRYGDIQELIASKVAGQYRNFRVAVSVAQLHGITVYVTGFAARPGSYTISSLSTLVNAVLAAGGPSGGGSFRSIQVRRNGQLISDFDLYDLLLKGDKGADVMLQNGDVIYVAPAGAQVAVIGSVNVEAIYEARKDETVYDMLLYAGGANTVADDKRLLVYNPTKSGGWIELSPSQVQTRIASRGEIVRVLSAIGIAQPLYRQPAVVTISGEVANPGRYYVPPGTPVSAVIQRAGGLTGEAFPYGTVFTRESVKDTQRENYDRAMRDLELLLTTQPLVSIDDRKPLDTARLTAVRSVVQQLKDRKPDGRLVLGIQPSARTLPIDMTVENNDTIYVPPYPVSVGVFGAVPSPASFQYRPNQRIGDYLREAGGVQKLADKSQIFVVRANGTLVGQGQGNIFRQPALPGDLIFVPVNATRGEFWARLRDISSVLFPGVIAGAAVLK